MKKAEKKALYISFSDVARELDVKPHVLRYWEKKIPRIKSCKISNRKFFKRSQVALIFKVKKLLEEGYSLEGIKKILEKEGVSQEEKLKKELLEELEELYRKLDENA